MRRSRISNQKIGGCKSNPEILSTTNGSEHIPSGFSMSTISSIKDVKHKHGEYRSKDHTKEFYECWTKAHNENN